MKITEIRVHPHNSEGNKVIEVGTVEGDYNLLNELFVCLKKSLDRKKISYVYKVENAPANYYSYSLKNSEFGMYEKYIPKLTKTWKKLPDLYNNVECINTVNGVHEFLTWVIEDQEIPEFEANWNFSDITIWHVGDDQARDYYKYSDEGNDYLQKLLLDCQEVCNREGLDIDTIVEQIKTSIHIDEILEDVEDEDQVRYNQYIANCRESGYKADSFEYWKKYDKQV